MKWNIISDKCKSKEDGVCNLPMNTCRYCEIKGEVWIGTDKYIPAIGQKFIGLGDKEFLFVHRFNRKENIDEMKKHFELMFGWTHWIPYPEK